MILLAYNDDIFALSAVRFEVVAFVVVMLSPVAVLNAKSPVDRCTVLMLSPLACVNSTLLAEIWSASTVLINKLLA